jgi:hypothetical protein
MGGDPLPRDCLDRRATDAQFMALPEPTKDESLRRLADWDVAMFGTLDATFVEPHEFVLDVGFF